MDESRADRFRDDLQSWAAENLREFPWRETDVSVYDVFVAEFFLTQTPATNVADVYPDFVDRYPSLRALDEATEEELVDTITPLGFQNLRSDALKAIAAEHETLPDDADTLVELPRVGPYVANATVCFALGDRVPILDRNVERVYERVFGDQWPRTPTDREAFARELLPERGAREYNLALLDFGAAVCRPDPRCAECFASEYCAYYKSTCD